MLVTFPVYIQCTHFLSVFSYHFDKAFNILTSIKDLSQQLQKLQAALSNLDSSSVHEVLWDSFHRSTLLNGNLFWTFLLTSDIQIFWRYCIIILIYYSFDSHVNLHTAILDDFFHMVIFVIFFCV